MAPLPYSKSPPVDYCLFDGILESLAERHLQDKSYWPPLQNNIVLLRHYLLSVQSKDGMLNYKKVMQMNVMAEKLAKKLYCTSTLFDVIFDPFSLPDTTFITRAINYSTGADVMYDYLYELQQHSGQSFWDSLPFIRNNAPRSWQLPQRKSSLFAHTMNITEGSTSSTRSQRDYRQTQDSPSQAAEASGDEDPHRGIEDLSVEDKRISVEEARKILEKFKLLQSDLAVEEMMRTSEDQNSSERLLANSLQLTTSLSELLMHNPDILLSHSTILQSLSAMANLSALLDALPGDSLADKLIALKATDSSSQNDLLAAISSGLSDAEKLKHALLIGASADIGVLQGQQVQEINRMHLDTIATQQRAESVKNTQTLQAMARESTSGHLDVVVGAKIGGINKEELRKTAEKINEAKAQEKEKEVAVNKMR